MPAGKQRVAFVSIIKLFDASKAECMLCIQLCSSRFMSCLQVYLGMMHRADVLLLMGAIHYQLKNYEQCIAFNDRCILTDPSMAEAHANLANALQQLGNMDMAIVYYQSALRLKPFFTDAYNNMASALVQKGLIPQAMECYMAALRINPNLVSRRHRGADDATSCCKHTQ